MTPLRRASRVRVRRRRRPQTAFACLAASLLLLYGSARPARAEERQLAVDFYVAHGTTRGFTACGRVLYVHAAAEETPGSGGAWENLVATARALESDEAAGAEVAVRAFGREVRAVADGDGLFRADFAAGPTPFPAGLSELQATAHDPAGRAADGSARGQVHVLDTAVRYAVITDIDDTLVQSIVTRKVVLLFNTFLKNARTMTPVPGTSRLYQLLAEPAPGVRNPVFYLSASPMNLHARLRYYLELHQYPVGPVLLKNLNLIGGDSLFDQTTYKLGRLRELFGAYPDLRFLCFGDNGERDPEIYAQLRREFPGRVLFTGIRLCTPQDPGDARFEGALATRSAFDAARALCAAGILTDAQALEVARATAGAAGLPAGFGLRSELAEPARADLLPAGVESGDAWERLGAFAAARWSENLAMAGWVFVHAMLGGGVGALVGLVAGLVLFVQARRRGWTRSTLRAYRYVAWVLPLWLALSIAGGCAVAGGYVGTYVRIRGYVLTEPDVRGLLLRLVVATASTRRELETGGGVVGGAGGRDLDAAVRREVERRVDGFLAARPGAGSFERRCVRELCLLFLGMAAAEENRLVMSTVALLNDEELAAAATAATAPAGAVLHEARGSGARAVPEVVNLWMEHLSRSLCDWVRDFVLVRALAAALAGLLVALLPIGVLRLADRWRSRGAGAGPGASPDGVGPKAI
ncbi:MAG: DUF2183 domain-containing protein [Planctomycetes bacterium]|nr:DUF2183 domain-containing protein [Planctomycetota bacterium]